MERTSKLRVKADAANRRLSWYAAVFDEVTDIIEPDGRGSLVRYREVIRPGAFAASLASGVEVVANLDHDDTRIFARRSDGSLVLQEDPHGLFCSAWVPEGEFGDSILARVDSGKLDGCSFRFDDLNSRTAPDGLVERLAVRLVDVCLTECPAYSGTHVLKRSNTRLKFLRSKLKLLKIRGR